MNHKFSVAMEFFPIPPWKEKLAKRQCQFDAKVASEQSWSKIVGYWAANFDGMLSQMWTSTD